MSRFTYAGYFADHAFDEALPAGQLGEQLGEPGLRAAGGEQAGFAAEEATRAALEQAVQPAVESYLAASEALVLGAQGTPNLALIADSDSFVKDAVRRVGEALRKAWQTLFVRTGEDLRNKIRTYLEGLKTRLGGLQKAVYKRGLAALEDAQMAHKQIDAVRDAVKAVLDPSQWQAYTDRVAQTEAVIAVNQARHALAMQAVFEGATVEKTWQTRKDARVRHAHKEIQGQTVPFAAPFLVDGWPMLYPGDPTSPPGLWINCRCGVTYKVVKP